MSTTPVGADQGQQPRGPQSGWFPVAGTTQVRYWDGSQWTDHFAPAPVPVAAASDDESLAMLPYVLGLFFGFIPALIMFFVKKDNPRVRFHSAQVLNFEIAYFLVHLIAMGLWVVALLGAFALSSSGAEPGDGSPAVFGLFLVVWLAMIALSFVRMGIYIWLAVKTSGGEDRTLRYVPQLVKP